MPISAEKQKLYPGGSIQSKEWKAIRASIQERAGDKCEWCSVVNYSMVDRGFKTIKIVCTTAHLDHDPGNNDESNLAFLCQKCHLTYDAKHHAANAAKTRREKLAMADMFE